MFTGGGGALDDLCSFIWEATAAKIHIPIQLLREGVSEVGWEGGGGGVMQCYRLLYKTSPISIPYHVNGILMRF